MANPSQIKEKIAGFVSKTRRVLGEIFVPKETNSFLPTALRPQSLFWYGIILLAGKIALISLALIWPMTSFFSSIGAERLLALINQERQARSLSALTLNDSLNSVAGLKVNDMLSQNYFDHTSPAGVTPWHWFKEIGYNYVYAGENLAMGFTETDAVFQAWMNSPTHRENILNSNYREIGLAVKAGQVKNHQETLAVLVFGRRAASAYQVPAAVKESSAPSVSPPVSSQAPASPKVTPAILAAPAVSPSPTAPAAASPAPSPSANNQEPALRSVLGLEPQPSNSEPPSLAEAAGYTPKVLGTFASKSEEISKSLYLYFALFLALALLVNIFIKFRIQYWPTIIATTLIITLSAVLIFI